MYHRKPSLEVKNGLVTEILSEDPNLEGTISEIEVRLHELEHRYSVTHSNICIDSLPRDYEDGDHYVVIGSRPATTDEKLIWEAELTSRKVQTEAWRARQIEQLEAEGYTVRKDDPE